MQVDRRADHGSFDVFHPPDPDLVADCVHCGFCLPTCPTYALWGEEMDSPRGRIYLMKMALEGDVDIDATFVQHFDACLGCMACVTSCPSGVQYDKLIEATRSQIERNYPRGRLDRLFRAVVFWLFPQPRRLRVAAVGAWLYQRLGIRRLARRLGAIDRLPPRLHALEALMPDIRLAQLRSRLPERVRPRPDGSGSTRGRPRRRVGLVAGCIQSVFFRDVNAATARVLASEGCEVLVPARQGCCGALMVHAGREEDALDHARALIAVMEEAGVDTVVVNAAGCGSTLKEYGHLLRDDPEWAPRARRFSEKVRDVIELVDELEPSASRHPIDARVAYHDACHLSHEQGIRAEPRRALRAIPGLTVMEIPEPEICCGSAGIYNLVEPQPAGDLGRRKADNILSTRPDAVVTGNPGCLLQIRRHLVERDGERPPALFHPVQLIDLSIRGVDPLAASRPTTTA